MRPILLCTAFTLCCNWVSFGQVSLKDLSSLDLPHYPRIAEAARIEGIVKTEIEVNAQGGVTSAKAEGQPLLKEYVLRNVRTWKFEPSHGPTPRQTKMGLTLQFKITGDADKPFERVSFEGHMVVVEASPFPLETTATD